MAESIKSIIQRSRRHVPTVQESPGAKEPMPEENIREELNKK
jgi:hypothetical protein